ncbi:MAG: hypothetical protein HY812_16900 [Planctomycetes bacterium]|nr:hypothetical protein [Planctomycetota bacterium]
MNGGVEAEGGSIVRFPLERRREEIRRAVLARLGACLRRGDVSGARNALCDEPEGEEGLLLWGHVLERLLTGDEEAALDLLFLARSESPEVEAFARGDSAPEASSGIIEKFLAPAWAAHPRAVRWLRLLSAADAEPPAAPFDLEQDPSAPGYAERLVELFEQSEEARALRERGIRPRWLGLFLDYLLDRLPAAPRALDAAGLEEVMREILPAGSSGSDEDAGKMLAELIAFCDFLGREFGLPNTGRLRAVFDAGAAGRLHQALRERRDA